MKKTEIIISSVLIFSIGAFAGVMLNKHNVTSLKIKMASELRGYVVDIKEDLFNGNMLHETGAYYIHNMETSIEELEYINQETAYYE